jgi:hypothetical protein
MFRRNILSPSSGLKRQFWKVEELYNVPGRKAEGVGQSTIISSNCINQLILVIVKCCVVFAVQTEFLNII